MSDNNAPESRDENAPRPDIRRSSHFDLGVRVERDLTGSSEFLARGSKSHYSKIRFSSVGTPRTAEPAQTEAESAFEVLAAEEAVGTESRSPTPPVGFAARLKRLFRL